MFNTKNVETLEGEDNMSIRTTEKYGPLDHWNKNVS